MILVTVGTQLPFDRLIRVVDEAAPQLSVPIFAQTGAGSYKPRNVEWRRAVRPGEFDDLLRRSHLIVSHAGIGTVLMAQKLGKPILLLPRLARMKEHRNDHQVSTVAALRGRPGIYVADSEADLKAQIGQTLAPPPVPMADSLDRAQLKASLADYLDGVLLSMQKPV